MGQRNFEAKRLIFWEYSRESWQYGLIVALILLFIFATPRELFSDQPRAANFTLISSRDGVQQLFLEPEVLANVAEADQPAKVRELIARKTRKRVSVERVEAVRDGAGGAPKGYIAYARLDH